MYNLHCVDCWSLKERPFFESGAKGHWQKVISDETGPPAQAGTREEVGNKKESLEQVSKRTKAQVKEGYEPTSFSNIVV